MPPSLVHETSLASTEPSKETESSPVCKWNHGSADLCLGAERWVSWTFLTTVTNTRAGCQGNDR